MPSGDSPTGNGYEHDGPEGTNPYGKTSIGRKGKIRMEHKYHNEPESEPQENNVRCNIVNGKREPPDGQNGSKVAEDECGNRPHPPAICEGCSKNLVGGSHCTKPYSNQCNDHCDNGCQNDIFLPAVDHLSSQDPTDGHEEPCHWGGLQANGRTDHHISKGAGDKKEI